MIENTKEFSEINEELSELADTTCLICMEDNMTNDSILVASNSCGCSKFYHIECFLEWYQNEGKCLICHKNLNKSQINIFIFNLESNEWEIITLEAIMKIFKITKKKKYRKLSNVNIQQQQQLIDVNNIRDTSQDIERYEFISENNGLLFIRYICKIIFFLLMIIVTLMIIYFFLYNFV